MTSTYVRKKGTEFEIGDVIEVSMDIEYKIPLEVEAKDVICLDDYEAKYEINYSFPRNLGFSSINFTVDAGFSSSFCDDIELYLEESLLEDLREISEYELFDIDNTGEYQTAKIRIKALKEA